MTLADIFPAQKADFMLLFWLSLISGAKVANPRLADSDTGKFLTCKVLGDYETSKATAGVGEEVLLSLCGQLHGFVKSFLYEIFVKSFVKSFR